jgi:hypothetical protein
VAGGIDLGPIPETSPANPLNFPAAGTTAGSDLGRNIREADKMLTPEQRQRARAAGLTPVLPDNRRPEEMGFAGGRAYAPAPNSPQVSLGRALLANADGTRLPPTYEEYATAHQPAPPAETPAEKSFRLKRAAEDAKNQHAIDNGGGPEPKPQGPIASKDTLMATANGVLWEGDTHSLKKTPEENAQGVGYKAWDTWNPQQQLSSLTQRYQEFRAATDAAGTDPAFADRVFETALARAPQLQEVWKNRPVVEAPADIAQRRVGEVYKNKQGQKARWTGTGWKAI